MKRFYIWTRTPGGQKTEPGWVRIKGPHTHHQAVHEAWKIERNGTYGRSTGNLLILPEGTVPRP